MVLHQGARRSNDEESVQKVVHSLSASWNAHNMKAFAAVFDDDADFVNVGGTRWRGRKEIEEKHAEKHVMQFKESVLQVKSVDVRFLEPRVAIIHTMTQISGDRDPNGTSRPSPRKAILTAVAHKQNGTWMLVAVQNTNISSP